MIITFEYKYFLSYLGSPRFGWGEQPRPDVGGDSKRNQYRKTRWSPSGLVVLVASPDLDSLAHLESGKCDIFDKLLRYQVVSTKL